jgi:hypothetical protein
MNAPQEMSNERLVAPYIKSYNSVKGVTGQAYLNGYYLRQSFRYESAQRFGKLHGWTPMKLGRSFGFNTLAKGGFARRSRDGQWHAPHDHAYFYHRDKRTTAIAAHLYNWPNSRETCEAAARRYNLRFETPDFPSWHHPLPNGTTLIV